MECSDRKDRYARLEPIALRDNMPIAELLCIVDGKESHSYELPREERSAYYQACANEYGQIAQATYNAAIRAEMLHHQGKALRRCGQLGEALACFQRLLNEKPQWHATYGQIAHLGSLREADDRMREEGEKALRRLLDELLGNVYAVPLRVSLAAISRLRSYQALRDLITPEVRSVKQLADVVSLSALGGFDQFYEAFLAMTSLFGYRHGEACLAVAEAFPDMVAIFPNTVDERQWVNACEALTNLAAVAIEANKPDLARKLSGTAVAFAQELARTRGQHGYVARLLAKTFNVAGRPEDAVAAVNRIPAQSRDHWLLYQRTKGEAALGRHAEALATSQQALELASKDVKAQGRLAIYHDLVSQCFEALARLPEAIESATTAHNAAGDDKYRERLRLRLDDLIRKQA
jgi:tetratricopeptide (TPR) repeat protein